jgi:hypothetical protein
VLAAILASGRSACSSARTTSYYALLPDCGTAPCVAKRKQNEDCDVVIVTKAPGGSQDPAYRP